MILYHLLFFTLYVVTISDAWAETVVVKEAWTETKTIPGKPAWTEVIGYKCDSCEATK